MHCSSPCASVFVAILPQVGFLEETRCSNGSSSSKHHCFPNSQVMACTSPSDPTMAAVAGAKTPASDSSIPRSHPVVVAWLHTTCLELCGFRCQKHQGGQKIGQERALCQTWICTAHWVSCSHRVPAQYQRNQKQPTQQLTAGSRLRQRLRKYMLAHSQWREQQATSCRPVAAADTWAVLEHEEQVGDTSYTCVPFQCVFCNCTDLSKCVLLGVPARMPTNACACSQHESL